MGLDQASSESTITEIEPGIGEPGRVGPQSRNWTAQSLFLLGPIPQPITPGMLVWQVAFRPLHFF